MRLREYKKEDAEIICKWLRNEEELYKWSADRFNKFPLSACDINENYSPQIDRGKFIPLTAVDEKENILGHFITRYPNENDDKNIRFGFVIINPELRGKGFGKKMLLLGIDYAKFVLKAERIDLGVFDNNPNAKRCYESIGFKEYNRRKCELPVGIWGCIDMELFC